jgi:4-hydroxy-tetrahydrodipicolinate reductase
MGRALVRLASQDAALALVAALTRSDDPLLAKDAGTIAGIDPLNVPVVDSLACDADVLIEFTTPAGCIAWASACASRRVAFVSGTTGLGESERAVLADAARRIPVLWSANFSIGVNVLLELVSSAARLLGRDWDVEIIEAHHAAKVDAPSGTARALLDAVHSSRSPAPGGSADAPGPHVAFGRSGQYGPRPAGEIGVHALRLGGVVGDHDVLFASVGEVLTLSHRALSRDIFAAGALRAARWIVSRPPGLYQMTDALR